MKKLVIFLLLGLSLYANTWYKSEIKASQKAVREQKPIILFIHKPGCPWCEKIIEGFNKGELKKVFDQDRMVFWEMDWKDPRIEKYNYSFNKVPAIFFLDPMGAEVGQHIDGYLGDKKTAELLHQFSDWWDKTAKPLLGENYGK